MYEKFIKKVNCADSIAIFMHVKPDGDCVGSSLGLYKFLINMGKKAYCMIEPGQKISENLKFLPNIDVFDKAPPRKVDLAIAVDCGDSGRLGQKCYARFSKCEEKLVIDHHAIGEQFSDMILETKAAATTEILYKIFKETDPSLIDKEVATCLFTGLMTDTGSLVYASTTYETYMIASELCKLGADNYKIIRSAIKERSINAFKLANRVLANTEFSFDNRIAIAAFSLQDFSATNTSEEDTKALVSSLVDIIGVLLAVTITQTPSDEFKISFRSKDHVNAGACSLYFGGGGHFYAGGCTIRALNVEEVKKQIYEMVVETKCLMDS
jgi:phosphoesterase RecJ-like protein